MPRVLITGANGFLGSRTLRELLASGSNVLGTDQSNTPAISGSEYFKADILDPTSLIPVMSDVTSVIHAAGLAHMFRRANPELFKAVNEVGTANVAHAAARAGVRHFVLVSSVSVYGGTATGVDERRPCRPEGAYAESKWLAEQRVIETANKSGMPATILRLATLYGEGDPGNVARLMRTIDRGRFVWVGNGSNLKSLLYRGDAVRACLAVLGRGGDGIQIYNVTAPVCSMRQVVEGLASALGRAVPRWRIPKSLALGLASLSARLSRGHGILGNIDVTITKWLADDAYDSTKFERTFRYHAETSLTEGLRREVAWYKGQADLRGT